MNFKELQDDAIVRCKAETKNLRASFRLWLNQGQQNAMGRYLFRFAKWDQTVTTANGTATYALDYSTGLIYGVRLPATGQPLSYQSDFQFDRSSGTQAATGTPYVYVLPGVSQADATARPRPQIKLYPVPSSVQSVTVRSFRLPFAMSNDGDYPMVPEEFHEMLINYAAKTFYAMNGDERAASEHDLYETGLLNMVERFDAEPADRIDRLRSQEESTVSASSQATVSFPANFPNFR